MVGDIRSDSTSFTQAAETEDRSSVRSVLLIEVVGSPKPYLTIKILSKLAYDRSLLDKICLPEKT